MRQKNFHILCLLTCLLHLITLPAGSAEVTTEILQEYKAQQEHEALLARHTLAAPLLTNRMASAAPGRIQQSFFDTGFTMGSEGKLFFERLTLKGIRVFFSDLQAPSHFFWKFSNTFDLRNRWIRMRYAGETVPEQINLAFEGSTREAAPYFNVYLVSSRFTQSAWVKIPDSAAFRAVNTVRLRVDPGKTGVEKGDFWILDMELVDPEDEPLAGVKTLLADRR